MAHFFAPDRHARGYDVDGKLAPDSVWRMRILTNQRRTIGLWGGRDLSIRSNNPAVVPNDGFGETMTRADGVRMLSLLGKAPGTSLLETSSKGNRWCVLQVVVVDVDASVDRIPDRRHLDMDTLWGLSTGLGPVSGSVPAMAGVGAASVARIPVPGTNLVIELSSRGYKGSTSTIFIWEGTAGGKFGRHLRLDYGYNTKTKTIDYHWNRQGPASQFFGIQNHATVGKGGEILFKAGRYLKWGGRVLFVVGATIDVITVATSNTPLKTASQAVAGWAGAWAGCKVLGSFMAGVGTGIEPGGGTAIGGIVGCIIGGATGYYAASGTAGKVYDWAEGTVFTPLPAVSLP
jgi:hypothetical protein